MYENKPGSYLYIREKSKIIDVHDIRTPRTSSIACCIPYHYAMSVNFLVARKVNVGLYTLRKTFTTHGRPRNRSLGLNGSGTPRQGPPGRPWRAGPVQVSAY